MKAIIKTFVTSLLLVVCALGFVREVNTVQAQSVCPNEKQAGWSAHDTTDPFTFTAPAGYIVDEVCIKGGNEENSPNGYLVHFTEDDWYTVTYEEKGGKNPKTVTKKCVGAYGIGTQIAYAQQGDAAGYACAGISHVSFHVSPVQDPCSSDDKRGFAAEECNEPLIIESRCTTDVKHIFDITNPNDVSITVQITVDGDPLQEKLVPANSTVDFTTSALNPGITTFTYKLNDAETKVTVEPNGKICEEPEFEDLYMVSICNNSDGTHKVGIFNPNNFTVQAFIEMINMPFGYIDVLPGDNTTYNVPQATPGTVYLTWLRDNNKVQTTVDQTSTIQCEDEPTPTPTPTSTPNPSPEPKEKDINLTYSCADKRWNAEVILKRNNAPVTNAVVEYQFYTHKDTRRTDTNGINNFQFNDEGKGVLKVYPETFNGREINLDPPSCAPEAGEPQAARSRVLGASTTFANTGSAETMMAQIAFAASIVASAVAMKLARISKNA